MRKYHVASIVGLLALLLLLIASALPTTSAQDANLETTREVIARINKWRMDLGLTPLRPNPLLTQMAFDQASYLAALEHEPKGLHQDAEGREIRQRAALPQYGWPPYGSEEDANLRLIVDEMAAISGVDFAMNFWQHSPPHTTIATNPHYREIGAAAIPYGRGRYVIIAILGGQPNVLPVFYDPRDETIILTNDRIAGARDGGVIHTVTRFRYLDDDEQPLSKWMVWHRDNPLPEDVGDHFWVEYDDGERQVVTEVDLVLDTVLHPETIDLAPGEIVAALLPTPAVTYTPTPTQEPPNITFIYDTNKLELINTGPKPINLSSLLIRGEGYDLTAGAWLDAYPNAPLSALPPGACLGVWNADDGQNLPPPNDCRVRVAARFLADSQFFWIGEDFSIFLNEERIASCEGTPQGSCLIFLPPDVEAIPASAATPDD